MPLDVQHARKTMEAADESSKPEVMHVSAAANHVDHHYHQYREFDVVPLAEEAIQNAVHVNLTWRSWLVVFICCFA